MTDHETQEGDFDSLESRGFTPNRKSSGPGRASKVKARRASRRKQGGGPVGGIHRRGSGSKR